ncbi:predicted protein [Postia placenta Mad-698-R]|uniref:J domain-containing protein n=1 Tax=Postia placenta MAD-698-R-SB12 TaxID=670580 RepID=A0A1X6MWL4_9APHY|nr:hypothetical protein POSPLADRAFT_1048031 [Postia placenta MAD-698-R-SB12]EED84394.1 predicted protein [Postia placenta Mad-698-R]OSX60632.1 hypothetical protein POSPLADRAFT_1048031 [Postia placenta MAD-698-R-SB12]
MANYSYDEAGNMAAYFLLTFLSIILIPLSLSSLPSRKSPTVSGCQCRQCVKQRENIRKRERGSLFTPKLRRKTIFVIVGWTAVAFLAYKVATTEVENKVYDPFEILGLRSGVDVKAIKSHYKKLSRKFHPDKVKLSINETIEAVEAKFVEITKAYKSLTDETIRKNWEMYGHPDGRQEVSMGIALPKWIVESGNNIWVLGAYGLIFGGALPAMVGRWWFGNRQKTKDGVNARSAATFFKTLNEESGIDDVIGSLGKAFEWERPHVKASKQESELVELEAKIQEQLDVKWSELKKLAEAIPGSHESRRRALVLLYAHLLRLPVTNSTLRKEQAHLLLQTPTLLNSMLNISITRNWLQPTLAAMRLYAYLAQALPPGQDQLRLAQLPGISMDESAKLSPRFNAVDQLIESFEKEGDERLPEIKKAAQNWGKVEIVDAAFKVLGERYITPSAFISFVLKARIPSYSGVKPVSDVEADHKAEDTREQDFLAGKGDVETLLSGETSSGWAHAPFWPSNRKPSWWVLLADVRTNKLVVPPMKIADVPIGSNYRMYKMQFQGPPATGTFHWRVHVVSDTFVGEEVTRDVMWKVDDVSVLNTDDQNSDDDISEPEEDSLAGQMALMRGGTVKKRHDEESDDESSTDDDQDKDSDGSSSDSD